MQTVEVNSCQNVRDLGGGDIKFGKQFDFAPRSAHIDVKLTRDRYEILL